MIEIKPFTENSFYCPECNSVAPTILDTQLHSVYTMAECKCRSCGLEFQQTFPLGHCVNDNVSVRKSDGRIYTDVDPNFWVGRCCFEGEKRIAKQGSHSQEDHPRTEERSCCAEHTRFPVWACVAEALQLPVLPAKGRRPCGYHTSCLRVARTSGGF